jgi:nucleoside-diphosphate-sugar epimerase
MLPILVKSHKVYVLTSQTEKLPLFRQAGAHPLFGNLDDQSTLHRLSQIADTVIHLAPPNPNGTIDLRTKSLIQALSKGRRVRRFIYISTTGVYGDCGGQLISETQAVQPQNLRAVRRVDAERQLRAWAIQQGVSVVILRVPGIYAGNRLPVERLQKGTPALLESEDVFTNHIHADDLARLTILSMYRASPQRVINACDNSDLKMADYFDLVADKMKLPKPPRVDKETLKTMVSPQLLSFMQESRRISNARLQEIGFKFLYPTVQDFLDQI